MLVHVCVFHLSRSVYVYLICACVCLTFLVPGCRRQVFVRLKNQSDKWLVFKDCSKLKENNISVQGDLCKDTKQERKRQLDTFNELSADGKKVQFRGPILYLDGKPFKEMGQEQ